MKPEEKQGNGHPKTKEPTKKTTKNKPRVLSVRLSYEDYGKLYLECDSCGDDFPDYVRSKLTRDTAAEAKERGRMGQELAQLRADLKQAQATIKAKAAEVDKLTKAAEVATEKSGGISAALEEAQRKLKTAQKDATGAAQSVKKLQEQAEAATERENSLKTALKAAQEECKALDKELKNARKSATEKETAAGKAAKARQQQLSKLTAEVEKLREEREGFKSRLDKANAYLKEKAKGFLGDKLMQF